MKKQIKLRVPDHLRNAYESKSTDYICIVCGKFHNPELENNENFITFAGDVYVGLKGGMIGGNFNALGQLNRVMLCCRKDNCLKNIVDYLMDRSNFLSAEIEPEEDWISW